MWYCFFRFLREPVCLFKQVARTAGAKKCCFWKTAVCVCICMWVCVIELCQACRAKLGLLGRNCLFTGYTTVYLRTIRLAGLLHWTPLNTDASILPVSNPFPALFKNIQPFINAKGNILIYLWLKINLKYLLRNNEVLTIKYCNKWSNWQSWEMHICTEQ